MAECNALRKSERDREIGGWRKVLNCLGSNSAKCSELSSTLRRTYKWANYKINMRWGFMENYIALPICNTFVHILGKTFFIQTRTERETL